MLEELLVQNEGKALEFKENLISLDGIIKTIVAFANTAGGTIVIGVKDATKEVVGVADVLKEEERLACAIADSIVPSIMPDIEIQTLRNKEIIIIHVYHAVGPYYLKSAGPEKGVYVRLGSTKRIADTETLHRLRLFANNKSSDEAPYLHGSREWLDWSVIKDEFKKVNKEISDQKSQMLGMLVEQSGKIYPTSGGVLLFGAEKTLRYPDAIVQCAQFSGINKVKFLDQVDIRAHMPLMIEKVITFIEQHTKVSSTIGRMKRVDIPQYPPVAVREAVINAILHADYEMKGASISVAIFDDRIEITNPGGLHFGMTLENALAGSSRLRNRVIGRVLRELKFIERWGSGLKRIQDACEQQGLMAPWFQELNNQFRVTLYATKVRSVAPNLTSWEYVMITYLKKNGQVSTKNAAEVWAVTTRTASNRLKRMLEGRLLYKIATSSKDPHAVFVLIIFPMQVLCVYPKNNGGRF